MGSRKWAPRAASSFVAIWLCASTLAVAAKSPSLEAAFDAQISVVEQSEWLERMSSAPNHVGSPHDKANAEFMLAKFREWGWDAHIESFQVLYPTPISTVVEMVAPEHVVLGGQEPAVPGDPSSANTSAALPPYVVFQGDGDVTADLVYVNFGMPDDYAALARRGIDVRGKIVLARYGGGWRGLKPKLAQQHAAVGCILYSDPADDGYSKDDVYPKGGARPGDSVQRGSVADMTIYPGDPLTLGVGAIASAKRLSWTDAPTILKIPVLPMSYNDASKLLSRLGGLVVPAGWSGGLPVTYHFGGDGAVMVHLAVKSDWSLKPIYDVIAMLKGAHYPDQWVIRGNHQDGWVFGATDPLSGSVAMLSEAKALGQLHKQGWRPARTIVYASWDAEEPMLQGSTEWGEQHAAELKAKAVLYINSDGSGRGALWAFGSHEFQHFVTGVASDVIDPETGASIAERARAVILVGAFDKTPPADTGVIAGILRGGDIPIEPLGSGSDFSVFVHHLGIPAISLGFAGEDKSGGTYHSIYDSYHYATTFYDPGLKYGAALSKMVGRAVLRASSDELLPQRFGDFATIVAGYVSEIKSLVADQRAEDDVREALRKRGAFRLASDPRNPVSAPRPELRIPDLKFGPLDVAVLRLQATAAAYDHALALGAARLTPATRRSLNSSMHDIGQLLLDDRGLPERVWYKNLVYAPGRFSGYGAKTLPGIREAIEERRFDDAILYTGRTAKALSDYAARLDAARALIERNIG